MLGVGISDSSDSDEADGQVVQRRRILERRFHIHQVGDSFRARFRLSAPLLEDVFRRISGHLRQGNPHKKDFLSSKEKFLLTVRFLSDGGHYMTVGDGFGVTKSSMCKAVHEVTDALSQYLFPAVVCWPSNQELLHSTGEYLEYGNFPAVMGLIDGTLIKIKPPKLNEEQFVDRKNNHSINCQVIATANYKFVSAFADMPGSCHDSRVLRLSPIGRQLENGWRPFPGAVLLGDSGYPNRDYLVTPLLVPITIAENRYNVSHKRTRVRVENSIGILKSTFRCLLNGLRVQQPIRAVKVIESCIAIHNIRIDMDAGDIDEDIREFRQQLVEEDDQGHGEQIEQLQRRLEIIRENFSH